MAIKLQGEKRWICTAENCDAGPGIVDWQPQCGGSESQTGELRAFAFNIFSGLYAFLSP